MQIRKAVSSKKIQIHVQYICSLFAYLDLKEFWNSVDINFIFFWEVLSINPVFVLSIFLLTYSWLLRCSISFLLLRRLIIELRSIASQVGGILQDFKRKKITFIHQQVKTLQNNAIPKIYTYREILRSCPQRILLIYEN